MMIVKQPNLINQDMIDATNFLKNNTSKESKYVSLIKGDSQADEWIPYLSSRTPLIGFWGSEWTSGSDIQEKSSDMISRCTEIQEMICVDNVFKYLGEKPNYLVVETELGNLVEELQKSISGKVVYKNSHYIVFHYLDSN
jgi:hypothetical protein